MDHVLEEDLEDSVSLLIDEPTDVLDAAPPVQASDRRLNDALDIVTEHFVVALYPCPTPYRPSPSRHRHRIEQSIYKFLHKFKVILEQSNEDMKPKIREGNSILWSPMITGYAHNGENEAALHFLSELHRLGTCPSLSCLTMEEHVSCLTSFHLDESKRYCLMEFFHKCPFQNNDARIAFDMSSLDILSAIIPAYVQRFLLAHHASRMIQEALLLLIGLISAHPAAAIEVWHSSKLVSYAAGALTISAFNHLVRWYARCEGVGDARRLFDEMPQRNVFSWTSLMVGYVHASPVSSFERRLMIRVGFGVLREHEREKSLGGCIENPRQSEELKDQGKLHSGHEYVDAVVGADRLLVDAGFRSEFEVARPSKTYRAIIQLLPQVFVGQPHRLQQIVVVASEAAWQSLKKNGLHVPPWRRHEYMRTKWFSAHHRAAAVEEVEAKDNSTEEAMTTAIEVVGSLWTTVPARPKPGDKFLTGLALALQKINT
ncbi:hypothetical protein ZIOFF_046717 [Zingiber officinale]|uniref:Pentatricopeptide repeat-containing protein n=1 Tax=Zingiber officinale TaxID=94328 RepID=A0A8J5KW30_ZINOF|nr:hypothetical protein ZIOFF_046717 [Zingiber officinale]